MTERPPIVVFDLDGTLVDTAPDLLDSLNHVIATRDLAPVALADFRPYVGHGGRYMLERVFRQAARTLEEAELTLMIEDFIAHYGDNMPGQSLPFAHALTCIDDLQAAGFITAVCTNKRERGALDLLNALGIAGRFSAICGQDTFAVRKPHPDHLFGTIEMAGGDPARAIMVGDTPTDFDTAHAAKIPLVAVDFGYCAEPVSTFNPALVISGFDELTPEMANRLIAAQR